ncbi:hypothetical protein LIER_39223 [Lithospermum erythrorhizon]|uniref:Retroviral polymerase SH3-like domain-containing protein n=1 Tax=Lithospermum erythrorhizon TaxID=34254 RepID=A0AAV3QFL7_LITER
MGRLINPPPVLWLPMCGFCISDLGEKFQQKQDNEMLHDFLCGIHVERFGALRSSPLSHDPPPTLDRAYDTMLQEEQLHSQRVVAPEHEATLALAVQASRGNLRSNSRSKGNISCTFCHRSGHDILSCVFKHGFPDWLGDLPSGSGRGAGLKLVGNQLPGGDAQDRPGATVQAGQRHEAALAAYEPTQGHGAGGLLSNSDLGTEDRLTGTYLISNWIIDTGASSHITGDLNILFDIVDIPGCPIGLPGGKISSAIKSGTKCKQDKFDSRTRKSIFFAYPYGKMGWKRFDLESHEYFVSRDIVFYENDFPYLSSTPSASVTSLPQATGYDLVCDDDDDVSDYEGTSGESSLPSTLGGGVLPRSIEQPAPPAEDSSDLTRGGGGRTSPGLNMEGRVVVVVVVL